MSVYVPEIIQQTIPLVTISKTDPTLPRPNRVHGWISTPHVIFFIANAVKSSRHTYVLIFLSNPLSQLLYSDKWVVSAEKVRVIEFQYSRKPVH
jgi:hypothetical protein